VAKGMPKPLIDLTPQYEEPPQHSKKGMGHGHKPDHLGPGGLIEAATSPEDFIGAPPSTDWRGRNGQNAQNSPGLLRGQGSQRRARSKDMRPGTTTSRSPPSQEEAGPWSGEGLMAGERAHAGWGGGERGRGVMDGSRAKGPMLDMSEESKYTPGSLLNKVASQQVGHGLVIDREKEG